MRTSRALPSWRWEYVEGEFLFQQDRKKNIKCLSLLSGMQKLSLLIFAFVISVKTESHDHYKL